MHFWKSAKKFECFEGLQNPVILHRLWNSNFNLFPANLLELEMTQSWIYPIPNDFEKFFRLQTGKTKKNTLKNIWSSSSISSSFNGFQTIWKAGHLVTKFPPGWHSPQLLSAISLKKDWNWIVHNPDAVTKQAIWTKQLHGDHHILEAFKGTFSVYGFDVIGDSSHLLRFLK